MVTEAPNRSLPVASLSISAPAALKLLWPEAYSGNGGVGNVVGWYGSHAAPSIGRVPGTGWSCPNAADSYWSIFAYSVGVR